MTQVLAAPTGRDNARVQASTTSARDTLRCNLRVRPDALQPVRALVRAHLTLWDRAEFAHLACLGVNELMTNVIQHTRGDHRAALLVESLPNGVRVSVADTDHRLPVVRPPDLFAARGRGLYLLKSETDELGARPTPTGKIVYFMLTTREQQ